MAKTNHLGSHHPERRSYPANKMIPKEILKEIRKVYKRVINGETVWFGGATKANNHYKRLHNKKSRAYNKNIDNFSD